MAETCIFKKLLPPTELSNFPIALADRIVNDHHWMTVHCVRLPESNESDSSSGDLVPPPPPPPPLRHVAPKRSEIADASAPHTERDPFEVEDDDPETTAPPQSLDYVALGLPPLSFDSDPFLSPVPMLEGLVTRQRIWIQGVKGLKFTFLVQGVAVLVAKRRREVKEEQYLISKSTNYLMDSPDFGGLVVRQRTTAVFTVLSPRERQADGHREALAALKVSHPRRLVIGTGVWLPPKVDSMFAVALSAENSFTLEGREHRYRITSEKNTTFGRPGEPEPLFVSKKASHGSISITIRAPLSVLHGFGLGIALFAQ
jgi:hypothetical protein